MAAQALGIVGKGRNEATAIRSLRAIHEAQLQYSSTYPARGFASSLSSLGGDPKAGPAIPQFLRADLSSGIGAGYIFHIGNVTRANLSGADTVTGYQVTAVPQIVGKTGNRGFCSDEFGTIKSDPAGGTNCTQNLH
jgi:type IV pilus assembly protein PilA